MTQEQIEFQQKITLKAKQKGWFIAFLVTKVLPFIIENWDDFFPKREKLPNPKTTSATLCGGLEKPTYNQSQNGRWECIGNIWTWVDELGYGG